MSDAPHEAASYAADLYEKCALERIQLRADRKALAEALRNLLARVDINGGIGEYKSGPAFVVRDARDALRYHGGD